MNIPTIEMAAEKAQTEYAKYRTAVRERYGSLAAAREADQALVRAYRSLAKGQRVLDVVAAMSATGRDSAGMPVLAICRASAKWCACRIWHDGHAIFQDDDDRPWTIDTVRKTRGDVGVPAGTFDAVEGNRWGSERGRAMVPEVPIHLHPKHDLSGYHILWEATWEPVPPGDPLLLKHLGGDLYAVLAQWDLTPIEQAVLRGLRNAP